MFNVSKTKLVVSSLIATSLLISCSKSKENEALECLGKAKNLYETEQYDAALALLDTLDSKYVTEVKVRRSALNLRPKIMEKISLKSLEVVDREIAELVLESEQYKDSLKFVPDAFEGYYTTSDLVGKIPAEKSGLYARMTSEGFFTVISSSTKSALSEGITLTAGGESVSTPSVAHDGERNDRSRGVEIINFMPAECDTLGIFAAAHINEPVTLTFNGEKPYSMQLPKEQVVALAKVHQASKIYTALRRKQNEKSRLEKQLTISRSQQARTFNEDSEK